MPYSQVLHLTLLPVRLSDLCLYGQCLSAVTTSLLLLEHSCPQRPQADLLQLAQVQHGKTAPAHLAHHIKDTVPGEAKSPQTLQKPVMYPLVAADPPFTAPAAAPKQRLVQPRVPISPAAHPPWEVVPLYSPRLVGAAHEHAVGPAPMTLQLSPDQQQQQQQAIDIQAELVTEVTATTPDTEVSLQSSVWQGALQSLRGQRKQHLSLQITPCLSVCMIVM